MTIDVGCEHVTGRNKRCVRCIRDLLDQLAGERALVASLRASLSAAQAYRPLHRDDCIRAHGHRYFDGTPCSGCVAGSSPAADRKEGQ